MVGKCANPACEARFRYLHKGKLFVVEESRPKNLPAAFPDQRRPDYVWLCEDCSRTITVPYLGGRIEAVSIDERKR